MTTFEQAFDDTERAAASAVKAAINLLSVAKRMQKAAQDGNIASLISSESDVQKHNTFIEAAYG